MIKAILIVVMNSASQQGIPLGLFESIELCEEKLPLVEEQVLKEWPEAYLYCYPIWIEDSEPL